ncbi:hypothetical protein LTR29_000966 [Friedmanniomyces endolithicus]|nr:hypothetical protein LTR29_000966 [Friedmanniomyces endolithicus]
MKAIDRKFERVKQALSVHVAEFDAEARLASVASTEQWHTQISARLQDQLPKPVTNALMVPHARNPIFTGRDGLLSDIHGGLVGSSFPLENNGDMKSMALYGIGGIGKTQLAVEYAYRHCSSYNFIIWLRAETEMELAQSFADAARSLGLAASGDSLQDSVEAFRRWLASNCKHAERFRLRAESYSYHAASKWLLIYDNVTSVKLLRRYWPASSMGNIIVTSQRSDLHTVVNKAIKVAPLTTREGSTLVRRILGNAKADIESSEQLCEELGGHALAIAHYAGYAATTQLTARDVTAMFNQRHISPDVWSATSHSSFVQYERTLGTVWAITWPHINDDSRRLLDVLSLLNPESIPETYLEHTDAVVQREGLTRSFCLKVLLSPLLKYNLLERDGPDDDAFLIMHRVLKRALQHELDINAAKRRGTFTAAVSLVRNVYPRRSMIARSSLDRLAIHHQVFPHLLSTFSYYEQCADPELSTMEFADLLMDGVAFLWEESLGNPMPLLLAADRICHALQGSDIPGKTMIDVKTWTAAEDVNETSSGWQLQLPRWREVVKLREQYYASLDRQDITLEDEVDLGRAWNDLGSALVDLGQYDEGQVYITKAMEHYMNTGGIERLRYRISKQYGCLSEVYVHLDQFSEAVMCSQKSLRLTIGELGPDHHWTLRTQTRYAYILAAAGHIEEAFDVHAAVLAARQRTAGKNHPDNVRALYWLGTICQAQGKAQEAESHLLAALSIPESSQIGEYEMNRLKLRLAQVYISTGQHAKAQGWTEASGDVAAKECYATSDTVEARIGVIEENIRISPSGRSTGFWRFRSPPVALDQSVVFP